MNYHNPAYTPAGANMRIRTLWRTFEQSQVKDRAQLDITIRVALEEAEAEWNKFPSTNRLSRIQRNATKAKIAKKIKVPYFDAARNKWNEMLEPLGLKSDYWTDLTEDEMRRITNILGAEDESDEDFVVAEIPPAPIVQPTQSHFFQPVAPSFSTSSRATNLSSSSYALVNPSEFNSEEEDFEYEIPFSNPVATSVDLTSEDDDDPVFSVPYFPVTRPGIGGSTFSLPSLAQNPASNSSNIPSARPLVSGFAYNAAPNGVVPTKRPQISQNEGKSTITKARIPRQPYVGPSLDAADEPIDEELEFEKFKMRTRMAKIVEFHEAAALAEISLSIEIYKARKQLNNSKEEDAPRVLDHQKRMVQLQREIEEQRKAIVKSERARRQSDLARRSGAGKEVPTSNGAFKTWDFSSFQEEINLPSRFNLDTLLSDDPAKQRTNVDSLLSELFADDCSGPDGSTPNFVNGASTSSNSDAVRGSSSTHNQQEQLRQSHSSMSWSKPRANPTPNPSRKTHLSPFGESSDEEDGTPAAAKPKASTPATTSTWSSKDGSTPVSSAWSSKKTATPITQQPRQGSSVLPNANPSFAMDEIEPEPTATPLMNPKTARKLSISAFDKSPVLPPPAVEPTTASSKAPEVETPAIPQTPTPALAPAPAGGKKNKKQRQQANKKGGAAAAPATVAAPAAIPEQEPETEPVLPQRESPKLETPVAAPNPVPPQNSEHTSWLPKTVPAMARARMDSEPTTPSFSWDEISSTPRPASKIPVHLQETLKKSEGTPRPSMLNGKKKNLMAEMFSATSSRTTLEQMPPASISKGPIWGSSSASASPGPSLWGKTKADFEPAKVAQKPAGGDTCWVPGGFDGLDNYKDEGDGGGGGIGVGGNEASLWESTTSHSKQNGKAASIPVKQQQLPVATQRLRRISEAASSSPAPRAFGTKGLSDIGQPTPPTVNANSKKAPGKKNGKGKQRAMIEDVSDEEKDNIDILPQDCNFIMEQKVILEPKPSVPPFVYNPIIDYADINDVNDLGYLSSSFRPTASTASSSSPDDFFGSESRFSNTFKTQATTTSSMGGKHARWTPAVPSDGEELGSPSFLGSVAPHLQAKPSLQQTPIWGQPNPSAKDKGKGKK